VNFVRPELENDDESSKYTNDFYRPAHILGLCGERFEKIIFLPKKKLGSGLLLSLPALFINFDWYILVEIRLYF